jgi:hypothetical protein
MSSQYFEEPKRTKKPGKKKAHILHARQYRHKEEQSKLYQNTRFLSHGGERVAVVSLIALVDTVDRFNDLYQDNLTFRHGVLILTIKQLLILTKKETFTANDIRQNIGQIEPFIAAYKQHKINVVGHLITDLSQLHFCNPVSNSYHYTPTTRIKLFCTLFEQQIKKYL